MRWPTESAACLTPHRPRAGSNAQGRLSAGRTGQRRAAKGQVGGRSADRPIGQRHRPGRNAVAANNSPGTAGRAIPAAVVFSAEPDSHGPVAGRFDLVRIDRTRLAVCWAAHDEHARLLSEYRREVKRCRWQW